MIAFIVFILIYFTVFFMIGTLKKNHSIVDIGWGLRLFVHILIRNKGKKEDFRYAAFRQNWGTHFFFDPIFKFISFKVLCYI